MARYRNEIRVPVSAEEAFAYLADFTQTAEWDPGVVEARQLTPGPVGKGTRFRVVVSFLGRRVPLRYTITEFDAPRRLVLEGGGDRVISVDEIDVERAGKGARIRYQADLRLKGLLAVADPLLFVAFRWIGNDAVAGLKAALGRR